ncbi:MAG: hypothetical protein NUW37_04615 [Planctomycetes bacterium]|nr:hypothetical protein [Planctomycetota bacterium]
MLNFLTFLENESLFDYADSAGATTITFQLWVVGAVAGLCAIPILMLVPAFIKGWKLSAKFGLVVSGAALLALLPGMFHIEKLVVTESSIEETSGFFFAPHVEKFEFKDISSVDIAQEIQRTTTTSRTSGTSSSYSYPNRRERTKVVTVWLMKLSSGNEIRYDPGTVWEYNTDLIIDKMDAAGVKFVGADDSGESDESADDEADDESVSEDKPAGEGE